MYRAPLLHNAICERSAHAMYAETLLCSHYGARSVEVAGQAELEEARDGPKVVVGGALRQCAYWSIVVVVMGCMCDSCALFLLVLVPSNLVHL